MENRSFETGVKGVFLQPLKIIPTCGGPVLHMLRSDYALMPDFGHGFGEIYFSEILPGLVKAWKKHTCQTQLFAVPAGLIRLVLFDARQDSPSLGKILEINLGRPEHYSLLRIPPGIWYGFQALSPGPALICNCADLPHDPEEASRLPWDSPEIPYRWAVGQRNCI